METLVPCLVCGVELNNFSSDKNSNHPENGTEFISHGHYGSIYDPTDGADYHASKEVKTLHINICNDCLTLAKYQQRAVEFIVTKTEVTETRIW